MLFQGLILFLFLIIIRPQEFVDGWIGLPLVFVVMGAVLLLWCLNGIKKDLFCTAQDKYFALFFLAIVVSTVSVGWIRYTTGIAVETLKAAMMYWFTVTIVNDKKRLKIVTWTTVVLMTIVAGLGILQSFGYDVTKAGMYWANDKKIFQIRGVGLFDNPNDLAYSVVLVIPFACGLFLEGANLFKKCCGFWMFLVASYCIYLTRSRGGYLAATTCLAIWFYFWISHIKLRRAVLFFCLVCVAAAFSLETKDYRKDKSSMGRVEAWAAGMDMFKNHPLIGVGKGQFIEHHERDSHSSYVRAGAELGFIGLYAFLGIIFSAFKTLFHLKIQEPGPDWKIYRTGFLAYLGSYVVASLFSTRTYDVIFMIVIAITAVMERLHPLENGATTGVYTEIKVSLVNKNIIALTALVIIFWKLFLIQVW